MVHGSGAAGTRGSFRRRSGVRYCTGGGAVARARRWSSRGPAAWALRCAAGPGWAPPAADAPRCPPAAMSALTQPVRLALSGLAPRRTAARCSAVAAPRVVRCAGTQGLACRASPLRACVAARSARLRATRRVALVAQASADGKQLVQDEEQSITKACGGQERVSAYARR